MSSRTEMKDSDAVAAVIRSRVMSGELPRNKPTSIWAGYGSDMPCDGCGRSIGSGEVEYEVDMQDGRSLRLHHACLIVWHGERG